MSSARIALGHNQVPVSFENIQPPLFALYAGDESIPTDFHNYVSREQDGNRNWVQIGLPYVEWRFFRLSRGEFKKLATYTGNVSIRTLDQVTNTYKIYNGQAKEPEAGGSSGQFAHDALDGFVDVLFTIYDLVQQ